MYDTLSTRKWAVIMDTINPDDGTLCKPLTWLARQAKVTKGAFDQFLRKLQAEGVLAVESINWGNRDIILLNWESESYRRSLNGAKPRIFDWVETPDTMYTMEGFKKYLAGLRDAGFDLRVIQVVKVEQEVSL